MHCVPALQNPLRYHSLTLLWLCFSVPMLEFSTRLRTAKFSSAFKPSRKSKSQFDRSPTVDESCQAWSTMRAINTDGLHIPRSRRHSFAGDDLISAISVAIDEVALNLIVTQNDDSVYGTHVESIVVTNDLIDDRAHTEEPYLLRLPIPAQETA